MLTTCIGENQADMTIGAMNREYDWAIRCCSLSPVAEVQLENELAAVGLRELF